MSTTTESLKHVDDYLLTIFPINTPSLYFRKRARSRSFDKRDSLLDDEHHYEHNHPKDNIYGFTKDGQQFEFAPKDYEIVQTYNVVEILMDEALSPTLVSLVQNLSGMVSKNTYFILELVNLPNLSLWKILEGPSYAFCQNHSVFHSFKIYDFYNNFLIP